MKDGLWIPLNTVCASSVWYSNHHCSDEPLGFHRTPWIQTSHTHFFPAVCPHPVTMREEAWLTLLITLGLIIVMAWENDDGPEEIKKLKKSRLEKTKQKTKRKCDIEKQAIFRGIWWVIRGRYGVQCQIINLWILFCALENTNRPQVIFLIHFNDISK